MRRFLLFAAGAFLAWATPGGAAKTGSMPVTVTVNFIDATGTGKVAGTITLTETAEGLELETRLTGLPPGEHGVHLHENPSCAPAEEDGKRVAGIAAGGHYDPHATKAHKGPGGGGHLGDLPKLEVDSKGPRT
jgi:superoxide dismutase, Cu-Zn family